MHNKNNTPLDILPVEKLYASLSYVAILCFIPLFFKRSNTFILFHGKQGLVLFAFELLLSFLRLAPVIGEFVFIFGIIFCSLCSIIGIVKICMNEQWEIPVIFDIAEKLPFN